VLVPIIERPEELMLLFTRRTDHLRDHAGQISFPGGRRHPGDDSPESTALREAEEEVGLPPDRVEVIGRLDTYVTRTGFEITPVVGLVRAAFTYRPHAFEVAEVFEVPLAFFCKPGNCETHGRLFRGKQRYFYAFPYDRYFIWGATAGILVNLAEVLVDSRC
jgi:8-oxo-dGTP pyrophosphatase MutT (NUDIX family)